jgi:hypothetical protein
MLRVKVAALGSARRDWIEEVPCQIPYKSCRSTAESAVTPSVALSGFGFLIDRGLSYFRQG